MGEKDYSFYPVLNALLQTNRESRELVTKTYKPCFSEQLRFPVYFDVDKDILYFQSPEKLMAFIQNTDIPGFTDGVRPTMLFQRKQRASEPASLNLLKYVRGLGHAQNGNHNRLKYVYRPGGVNPGCPTHIDNLIVPEDLSSSAKLECFKEIIISTNFHHPHREGFSIKLWVRIGLSAMIRRLVGRYPQIAASGRILDQHLDVQGRYRVRWYNMSHFATSNDSFRKIHWEVE